MDNVVLISIFSIMIVTEWLHINVHGMKINAKNFYVPPILIPQHVL